MRFNTRSMLVAIALFAGIAAAAANPMVLNKGSTGVVGTLDDAQLELDILTTTACDPMAVANAAEFDIANAAGENSAIAMIDFTAETARTTDLFATVWTDAAQQPWTQPVANLSDAADIATAQQAVFRVQEVEHVAQVPTFVGFRFASDGTSTIDQLRDAKLADAATTHLQGMDIAG